MTNMINSQPRFGYEETGGVERVFDYQTGRYTHIADDDTIVESTDGEWHGRTLINLIKTLQPVESARRAKAADRAVPDENEDPEAYANRRRIDQLKKDADERAERERVRAEQPDKVEQFKRDFVGDGISQQEHDVNKTAQEVTAGASQQGQQQIEAERQQREAQEQAQRDEAARLASEEELRQQQANVAAGQQVQPQG